MEKRFPAHLSAPTKCYVLSLQLEETWKNNPVFAGEILSLVEQIQLTPEQTDGVKDAVLQDLKQASSINNYPLQVYGSFVSTLADVISDVDVAYSKLFKNQLKY